MGLMIDKIKIYFQSYGISSKLFDCSPIDTDFPASVELFVSFFPGENIRLGIFAIIHIVYTKISIFIEANFQDSLYKRIYSSNQNKHFGNISKIFFHVYGSTYLFYKVF